jgi:hypothetical protein
MRSLILCVTVLVASSHWCAQALGAPPDDWTKIPGKGIPLFYPGQSSYEWLLSDRHEEAGEEVAEGESCVSCHEGEEAEIGEAIVSGTRLEPTPVRGKQGTIQLSVQVAYDDENAYFRFTWRTKNPFPGEAHPFLRFDGEKWEQYGYPKLDKVVRDGVQPGIYEDRLSMLIDDGSVPNFDTHGCWVTCHDGQRDMADRATADEVRANPVLGRGGLNKKDVRKYLPSTRIGERWDRTRSASEIAEIKARGGFLDLMQWRAHRSNAVGMADDFYVLEYRLEDAGKGPFSKNENRETHQPRFMYDERQGGSRSISADQIRKRPVALVRERNAFPFDPNVGWSEGDLIPAYVLSREDTIGSAADNKMARGHWENGRWAVLFTRSLNLAHEDDKTLKHGGVYTFGFAVHDDNITTRGHHVSFPVSVGFGTKADLEATRVP